MFQNPFSFICKELKNFNLLLLEYYYNICFKIFKFVDSKFETLYS